MSYNVKTYIEQGGEVLHVGKIECEGGGLMPNQAAASGTSGSNAIAAINALLIKLKDAGLMVGDAFTLAVTKDLNDTFPGHADRQFNTSKISSVAESDGVITITLSEKVSALKDFEAGNGWGKHKWLGIGVSAGITTLTDLKYNGANLTAEDATEASDVGLGTGYFVRWVAADLVLAGDNTQKSKNRFTLKAAGYAETPYTLKIVEPAS